ncbi:MAG: ABC transporter permease [Clostridia bacterium]|nr:ABC transporter permease [Clostridia bacterium]
MRSIMLMVLANIKKKKVQSILILITIMVSSLLFSTAIGLMSSMNKPYEAMCSKLNSSQDLLRFGSSMHDEKKVMEWWRKQEGVTTTELLPFYDMQDKMVFKGKKVSNSTQVTERPSVKVLQDKLDIVQGESKENPSKGEIWVPTTFASTNNIRVGDTISIPTKNGNADMKVSAIVVDPQFSSGLINPVRVWVAPGELERIIPDFEMNAYMLGIRFEDYSTEPALWKKFEEFLGSPFMGSKLDLEALEFIYTFILKIIGTIMLIFSIVIVVVVLFVMSFTISGAILADYKTIGILKSQGFSSKNVIMAYSGQYSLLAVLATPFGIGFSYLTIRMLMQSLIISLGFNTGFSMLLPITLTFVTIVSLTTITAFSISLKAGKIKPAESIRFGAPEKQYSFKKNKTLPFIKILPVTLILGIKQMAANKRQSLFMLASTIITVFVLVFSVNIYNSLINMGKDSSYWGFDNSQMYIYRNSGMNQLSHDELVKKLKDDRRAETVVPVGYVTASATPSSKNKSSRNLYGNIYDGDMHSIGLVNIEGRNPESDNEISIAVNTSKHYGRTVGDYLDMYLYGKKITFLITGVYQTISNSGQGYRLQASLIRELDKDFQFSSYAVNLVEGVDSRKFAEEYEAQYGEALDIQFSENGFTSTMSSITSNMTIPVVFVCVMFMAVSFIIIFNSTLMNIFESRKSFGIFKSIGMTPKQIRASMVYKVLILAVLSLLIGIPIGLAVSPHILGAMLVSQGVVKFPFNISAIGTIASIPLCLILTGISTWIPSGRILGISPRSLIVE